MGLWRTDSNLQSRVYRVAHTLLSSHRRCYFIISQCDVKKALVALDLLLQEVKAPTTPLLIQLSRLVFENNFLYSEFSTNIVHQDFGLAMGKPLAVTAANTFMYHLEKDIVALYSKHFVLYKRVIVDIFTIWSGLKQELLEFFDALNSKKDCIKINYDINKSSIGFQDLFLYKNPTFSTMQLSTVQKPLNKYFYISFKSVHPVSNKRAFIRDELMHYTRNSSTAEAFYKTEEKFWRCLGVRGYPVRFLLPLFREIKYSNRRNWLTRRPKASVAINWPAVFKTSYNCSHPNVKKVIQKYLPDLNTIVCYKSTTTLAHLCK